MEVRLPPGDYYVGDCCHVLDPDDYDKWGKCAYDPGEYQFHDGKMVVTDLSEEFHNPNYMPPSECVFHDQTGFAYVVNAENIAIVQKSLCYTKSTCGKYVSSKFPITFKVVDDILEIESKNIYIKIDMTEWDDE